MKFVDTLMVELRVDICDNAKRVTGASDISVARVPRMAGNAVDVVDVVGLAAFGDDVF